MHSATIDPTRVRSATRRMDAAITLYHCALKISISPQRRADPPRPVTKTVKGIRRLDTCVALRRTIEDLGESFAHVRVTATGVRICRNR